MLIDLTVREANLNEKQTKQFISQINLLQCWTVKYQSTFTSLSGCMCDTLRVFACEYTYVSHAATVILVAVFKTIQCTGCSNTGRTNRATAFACWCKRCTTDKTIKSYLIILAAFTQLLLDWPHIALLLRNNAFQRPDCDHGAVYTYYGQNLSEALSCLDNCRFTYRKCKKTFFKCNELLDSVTEYFQSFCSNTWLQETFERTLAWFCRRLQYFCASGSLIDAETLLKQNMIIYY